MIAFCDNIAVITNPILLISNTNDNVFIIYYESVISFHYYKNLDESIKCDLKGGGVLAYRKPNIKKDIKFDYYFYSKVTLIQNNLIKLLC